jgi:peptidyl-prolyl cis-trans isomerase SurA
MQTRLKSWLLSASLGLALAGAAPLAPANTISAVDEIVAIVNDEVITRSDLERKYQESVAQLKRQNTPLPERSVLEKQLLERMITQRAILQYARQSGIRVDSAQIDRAIQRVAQQNNLDLDGLKSILARDGVSMAQFRENLGNDILLNRARERDVDNKIVVTDAEVDGYLKTQAIQGKEDEYNLAQILIAIPEGSTSDQIAAKRARAEEIAAQLAGGADFGQLSASYSDASNALQGGNIGWRPAGQLPPLFLDLVKNLKPGETTPVSLAANGFHILKLLGKRESSPTLIVTQTRARHILLKPNELQSEADLQARLAQIRERLINGEDFAVLARQFSEDGSAAKGGELGWLNPGDTVPEFERAMKTLQVGEVSEPIKSPFGWHLIQVEERRDQDVTSERQRLAARQAIRKRKSDENFQEWVRQIRDSAYVDLRLPQ